MPVTEIVDGSHRSEPEREGEHVARNEGHVRPLLSQGLAKSPVGP